ncbi:MAG TPA: ATP-binding cassette domain-containing protein [Candidatus Limnocylindria bacterium]|nr:ATP-binding cassette domain-containing protein [Candidatus Limnocylindria bacterium]
MGAYMRESLSYGPGRRCQGRLLASARPAWRASPGSHTEEPARGGVSLSSSTPDALWDAPALRILRPSAIAIRDLTRRPLLDRCTLTVPAGMRLLLVSEPDESGSALVRILAGLARPERGQIEIAGLRDGSADGWARRVAHLGPEPGIHRWMTPREALELAARLLGLGADASRRIERAMAWVRIPPEEVDRPVARGGGPLLERTGLAAALIGDPEVLLLDEPLRSIEGRERTRMLRLPGKRRTVVLASRYPSSEAGLVSHVGLLRDGRVRLVAPVGELEAAGLPLTHRGIADLASR